MNNAIISVSNKDNILPLANFLLSRNFNIYSSGGTFKYLTENIENSNNIINIPELTEFPEILNGRVKTLHPKIYGGILADTENENHMKDISTHNLPFSVVAINLYPFESNNSIENIDIGGVSLIRDQQKIINMYLINKQSAI